MRAAVNPRVCRDGSFRGLFDDADYAGVEAFFTARPHLSASPLRSLPLLARELGLGALRVKDETHRYGVEAFKIVGVSYAMDRLGAEAAARGVACATAGNHGRAVARVARDLGVRCTVFVPAPRVDAHPLELRTRTARVSAMRDDGAQVVDVEGPYERAVREAAAFAGRTGATVVSDTSWPGYEQIPRWIMAGYTHVFAEAEAHWTRTPDAIVVQGGVGGLVCAAASWAAWRLGAGRPAVIACEPDGAACLMESMLAGAPVSLPGPLSTIMAGLRCGEPSPVAWPAVEVGVDAFVSVQDGLVVETIGRLRAASGEDPRLYAGPSGACGVAAVVALMRDPALEPVRRQLGLDRASQVLAIVTEGA